MTPVKLREHAFVKTVFEAVRPVMAAEHEFEFEHPGSKRVPDEREFYLLRVGNRLALLLSHCEQLSHALLFLSTYRETPPAARAGASRQKYLRYMIENYIVRTQTLYDLVLKLVDGVFHLMNADSQCRYQTIVLNLKVSRTEVPQVLERLRKKVTEFAEARNIVVHRGGYQDCDLYRIELYAEVEDSFHRSGENVPQNLAFLPEARREMARELTSSRKASYSRFNSSVFKSVYDVLELMLVHFIEEERRLHLIVDGGA